MSIQELHDNHREQLRRMDAALVAYAEAHDVNKRDADAIRRAMLLGDFSRLTRVQILVAEDMLGTYMNDPATDVQTTVYAAAARSLLDAIKVIGFPRLERIGRQVMAETMGVRAAPDVADDEPAEAPTLAQASPMQVDPLQGLPS